jgi:hypothetical protein
MDASGGGEWISDGYSEAEVAVMHGETVGWIRQRVTALRDDLTSQ